MSKQLAPTAIDEYLNIEDILPALKDRTYKLVRNTSEFTIGVARIYRSLLPLIELINRRGEITEPELAVALDEIFAALRDHPVTLQLRSLLQSKRWWLNSHSQA